MDAAGGGAGGAQRPRIAPLRDVLPDLSQDEYLQRLERSLNGAASLQPSAAIATRAWQENNPPLYDMDAYEEELKVEVEHEENFIGFVLCFLCVCDCHADAFAGSGCVSGGRR